MQEEFFVKVILTSENPEENLRETIERYIQIKNQCGCLVNGAELKFELVAPE